MLKLVYGDDTVTMEMYLGVISTILNGYESVEDRKNVCQHQPPTHKRLKQ